MKTAHQIGRFFLGGMCAVKVPDKKLISILKLPINLSTSRVGQEIGFLVKDQVGVWELGKKLFGGGGSGSSRVPELKSARLWDGE